MITSSGILLIDKPIGITSHDVIDQVRRITQVRRVGHAGTLDPLATGLLIVLVGREFTKLQDTFMKQDKEYICVAKLGITTDTYDSQGKTTHEVPWEKLAVINRDTVVEKLKLFRGEITQTVPAYSAVKIAGEKLYEKSRRGTIDLTNLPKRQVTIHQLQLINFEKKSDQQEVFIELQINCSSGTYVRSLIHDLGQLLGVGATVIKLRRTKIGALHLDDAVTLDELRASWLLFNTQRELSIMS